MTKGEVIKVNGFLNAVLPLFESYGLRFLEMLKENNRFLPIIELKNFYRRGVLEFNDVLFSIAGVYIDTGEPIAEKTHVLVGTRGEIYYVPKIKIEREINNYLILPNWDAREELSGSMIPHAIFHLLNTLDRMKEGQQFIEVFVPELQIFGKKLNEVYLENKHLISFQELQVTGAGDKNVNHGISSISGIVVDSFKENHRTIFIIATPEGIFEAPDLSLEVLNGQMFPQWGCKEKILDRQIPHIIVHLLSRLNEKQIQSVKTNI